MQAKSNSPVVVKQVLIIHYFNNIDFFYFDITKIIVNITDNVSNFCTHFIPFFYDLKIFLISLKNENLARVSIRGINLKTQKILFTSQFSWLPACKLHLSC